MGRKEIASGQEIPSCIGVGLKDFVDYKNGIWKACPSIPDFSPVSLAEMIWNRFGIPAVLDNDVHVATLAEQIYGAGKKYSDFVYFNVGTGIAIGMICDGRLIRGGINYAGEIGHMSIDVNSPSDCPWCGQRGCLENCASGGAIIQTAREMLPGYPDSALHELEKENRLYSTTIFKTAEAGDELANIIRDQVYKCILAASAAVIHIFNPQAVIYGGGVMTDGWILQKLKKDIPHCLLKPALLGLEELSLSSVGSDYTGVLGAAALGWEYLNRLN